MFAVGMTFTHNNGILRTKNNIMFASSLVFAENDTLDGVDKCVVYANQLVSLAFHAVFCAFKHDIRQIPCMLYQCTLLWDELSSQFIFFKALYTQVMPLMSVPPLVAASLQVGRPDLQNIVMEIYMTWLKRVKRPELVEDALRLLLKSTWGLTLPPIPSLVLKNGLLFAIFKLLWLVQSAQRLTTLQT